MGRTVRRWISSEMDCYYHIQERLEALAEEGLFLTGIGLLYYKFERREPKKVKYAVTFFSEGSPFNALITENQQTLMDYAAESGWQFIVHNGKMQIFMNEEENPVPFETDEKEKLENIKRCMKGSFLFGKLVFILVFLFNIVMQVNNLIHRPILFFGSNIYMLVLVMTTIILIHSSYSLIDYHLWCKASARSIGAGGGCVETPRRLRKIMDRGILFATNAFLVFVLFNAAREYEFVPYFLALLQVPFFIIIFRSSLSIMKKKKKSATVNRAVFFCVLGLGVVVYTTLITFIVSNFDITNREKRPYTLVVQKMTETETMEHKIYKDDIPLTCEDLYGAQGYPSYSYEARVLESIYLKESQYRQVGLYEKNPPAEIWYQVIETKYDFVTKAVAEELRKEEEWQGATLMAVDNTLFGATEAYQRYYDTEPTGNYILFYEDTFVTLDLPKELTSEQIAIIREKLNLG